MLLQLSCSTSHTSRGSSTLTFLIVQHVPQPAPGHSQWSPACEPPTRKGKWQPEILCCCSTRHLFLECTKQGVGPLSIFWWTHEFWLHDIFIIYLSVCYLTFFKTSLSFTKRQLKAFFSLREQGILSTILVQKSEHRSPAILTPEVYGCPLFLPQLQRVVFVIFWT